jgi:hypothetical protein
MNFTVTPQKHTVEDATSVTEQPKVMTLADIMTLGDDLDDLELGDDEDYDKEIEETKVG